MRKDVESTVLVLVGVFTIRVVVDGRYTSYVKEGLFWPLLASAALLLFTGLLSMRERHADDTPSTSHHPTMAEVATPLSHGHDHDHHGPGQVGYLLLVPIAILALVAPSPLGAFAAERASTNQVAAPIEFEYPELPEAVDGASNVTLLAVLSRALSPVDAKLEGNPVRLVGFVVPDEDLRDGYRLTRFTLGCCASDASAIAVRIVGVDRMPEADEWQEVVAVWNGRVDEFDNASYPVLELVSARTIDEPPQPYE